MNTSSRYTPSTTYSGCLVHSMVQALNHQNALAFLCRPPNTPTHARSTPNTKTKTPHTHTPPLGHKKRGAPTLGDPHSQKNCGSHLLSHTHQDAVPSTPQGLATRFEKETERFPPAITTAKPHNNTFTGFTPVKNGLLPQNCTVNTNTQNKYDYNVSLRSISTSQLHTLQRFHTRPINPVIYREPHTPKGCQENSSRNRLPA